MTRPLVPSGGNDIVYTPDDLAEKIVRHFQPTGRILEPCRGGGAFYNALLNNAPNSMVDWCEIADGRDFLAIDANTHYDYVVTNPPWSKMRPFLQQSMKSADNVIFLCLVNAFFMKARIRDIRSAGFGFKEILFVDTPPKPWPQTGFALGAVHIQKGFDDAVTFSD